MKSARFAVCTMVGFLMAMQQAYAQISSTDATGIAVPEINGSSALIAIGLAAGLVALSREAFFRK